MLFKKKNKKTHKAVSLSKKRKQKIKFVLSETFPGCRNMAGITHDFYWKLCFTFSGKNDKILSICGVRIPQTDKGGYQNA